MILAVLDKRAQAPIGGSDAYLSTVGGVRLTEPAADLAVTLALAGAITDLPLPEGTVAFGEVGLAGEVRPVTGAHRRLAEAARLGFTRAVVPPGVLGAGPVPDGHRASSRSARSPRPWGGPCTRSPAADHRPRRCGARPRYRRRRVGPTLRVLARQSARRRGPRAG